MSQVSRVLFGGGKRGRLQKTPVTKSVLSKKLTGWINLYLFNHKIIIPLCRGTLQIIISLCRGTLLIIISLCRGTCAPRTLLPNLFTSAAAQLLYVSTFLTLLCGYTSHSTPLCLNRFKRLINRKMWETSAVVFNVQKLEEEKQGLT